MNYSRPSTTNLAPTQDRSKGKMITAAEGQELEKKLLRAMDLLKIQAAIVGQKRTPVAVVFKLRLGLGYSVKTLHSLIVEISVGMGHEIEIGQDREDPTLVDVIVKFFGRSVIGLRSIIEDERFGASPSPLTIAAGCDVLGDYVYLDLLRDTHALIEGTTGSGKTIFIDDILMSLIYKSSPEEVRFMLVDPKMVDLKPYDGIQHLLMPVITEKSRVIPGLSYVVKEAQERKKLFAKVNVRDIEGYNAQAENKIPHLVVVMDEYKELADGLDVAEPVQLLLADGRQVGIHVILATQSALSEVIPSEIKNSIPLKVTFANASSVKGPDGKIRLLGSGDMLIHSSFEARTTHAQAAYVSFEEIERVVRSVRHRNVRLDYVL